MTKTIDKKAVGQHIRKIRLEMGYTMLEFGKLFNASKGVISNWENGYNLPNRERLSSVAFYGQMSVDELLHGAYCHWQLDDYEWNTYSSSCRDNELYQLSEGTPEDNNMIYCMYCGKKIKTIGEGVSG